MKRNPNYTKADAGQVLADVLDVAVAASVESRTLVRHHQEDIYLEMFEDEPPHGVWLDVLNERSKAGHRDRLHAAARQLARSAAPTVRPYVASAARRLVVAVADLMAWVPSYNRQVMITPASAVRVLCGVDEEWRSDVWEPTNESLARLDELRHRVWAEFVACEELLKDHRDAAGRVLCVAKRIAEKILEPADARLVGTWLLKLQAGDRAAA